MTQFEGAGLMWRKFSTCEWRKVRVSKLRRKIALIAVAVLCTTAVALGARDEFRDWIVLDNCHLIANPSNDGDSFHVSAGAKEYIFRLYLVDAPETDELVPKRVVEQAKYFGVTVPQAIETGRVARDFTREKLSEPFTVLTRASDAMGRSKLERFYAFVETDDGDLGEQLVRNGLARIYGFRAAPPGLRSGRMETEKLQQFEDEAKQEKIGAWGISAGRLNLRAQKPTGFSHFGVNGKRKSRATPPVSPFVRAFPTPMPTTPPAIGSASATPQSSHRKEKIPLSRIDINTAPEKELRTIPGIGPVTAARVIAARPFRSADDLKRVNGIGDKKYAQIRPYFQ